MAAQPARKLEDMNEDFNGEQMRSIGALAEANGYNPEAVLREAVRIKLISQDVVDKIGATMGARHVDSFQRAFTKEREQVGQTAAFIRAFEGVYGKFMLEQENGEIEKADGALMKRLAKALKFRVDPKFDLKGRPELQAVVRRLGEVEASRVVRGERDVEIGKLEAEKGIRDAHEPALLAKVSRIKGIEELGKKIGTTGDLEGSRKELEDLLEKLNTINLGQQKLRDGDHAKGTDLVDMNRGVASYNADIGELSSFFKTFLQMVRDLDAGGGFRAEASELIDELEKPENKPSEAQNCGRWENLLINRLVPLIKRLKPLKVKGNKAKVANEALIEMKRLSKTLSRGVGDLKKSFDKIYEIKISFEKSATDFQAKEMDREDSIDSIDNSYRVSVLGKLEEVKVELFNMGRVVRDYDDDQDLRANVRSLGSVFFDRYKECKAKFAVGAPTENSDLPGVLANFISAREEFVTKLHGLLEKPMAEAGRNLSDTQQFLAGYQANRDKLDSFKAPAMSLEEILDEAFGKELPTQDMLALETKSEHAGHKKAALDEDRKYFGGDEAKAVHKKYVELNSALTVVPAVTVVTAATLRAKKAALDLKNEEKAKLGELKELFAEKKTGELQDKFLELKSLLPTYLTYSSGNIEGTITGKKTDADLLKSTIDNYNSTGKQLIAGNILQEKASLDRLKNDPKSDYSQRQSAENRLAALEQDNLDKKAEYDGNCVGLRKLNVTVAQLEKFRDLFKTFRSDALERARGCEKAFKLGLLDQSETTGTSIKTLKDFLDDLNVDSITTDAEFTNLSSKYTELRKHFSGLSDKADVKLKDADYGIAEQKNFDDETGKIDKAKAFHGVLEQLVAKIVKATEHGVLLRTDKEASTSHAKVMEKAFKELKKPTDTDFAAAEIANFYHQYLEEFLGDGKIKGFVVAIEVAIAEAEKDRKEADKKLDLAKEAEAKNKNLTDAQVANRIMGVLVAQKFPELDAKDQGKIAKLTVVSDVGKLQSQESYQALANRGGAELLNTVNQVGLRGKLINFKYREGGNDIQPFKGFKPEEFSDWASIEALFDIGRLNRKNGFFLLALMERFDKENHHDDNVISLQTARLKKKLRALIAKEELDVEDKLDNSSVAEIVDEAFTKQLEKIRPLAKKHFENYDSKGGEFKNYMVEALNEEYEELCDKLKDGEISNEVYELKLKDLIKEAVEADVVDAVKFKQDEVGSQYWNSKEAQWLKDRGVDVGKFVGKTALDLSMIAPLKIAAWGGWGMAKAGTSLGFNALLLPFRVAKYPLLIAGKLAAAPINLFRKQPLTLPGISETLVKDVSRAVAYVKEGVTANVKGAYSRVGTEVKSGYNRTKFKTQKYKERQEKKRALRTAKKSAMREKAHLPVLEVASSPFLDYAPYKAKIAEAAKMLGVEVKGNSAPDVSAGPVVTDAHHAAETHAAPEVAHDTHEAPKSHGQH